jgi:protein TonB
VEQQEPQPQPQEPEPQSAPIEPEKAKPTPAAKPKPKLRPSKLIESVSRDAPAAPDFAPDSAAPKQNEAKRADRRSAESISAAANRPMAGRSHSRPVESGGRSGDDSAASHGEKDSLSAYIAMIQKQLNRYKKYPSVAKAKRQEGVSMIGFKVNRQGTISDIRLIRSSGFQELDEETLALLRRISSFPPLPPEVERERLDLIVPVKFSLR